MRISILLLIAIPCTSFAQVFSNLDFEYGVYKGQPRKWAIEGEGKSYFAELDSINKTNGNKSLYVTLQDAQVFVFLVIPTKEIAGRTVKVEGYVKSSGSDSLQSMIVLHSPGQGRPNSSKPIDPTSKQWQMVTHQASFPDFAGDRLLIALMSMGTGQLWLDNIAITIDGKPYGNGVPDFREPSKKEIKTLDNNAVVIESLDLKSGDDDLNPLSELVGDARIVALGENSHGSSSIFKLKLRMVRYLVEHKGFNVFALESPTAEADKINEYVLSGKGTSEDVITNLVYPSWKNQDMLNIVAWIKSYNETAVRKVHFRGFDMQDGRSALRAVSEFATATDPGLAKNINELELLYGEKDKTWKSIEQKAREIDDYLDSRTFPGVEVAESANIKHYVEVFMQAAAMNTGSVSRDECMANNIKWLLETLGDDARIIVSADNTHVTKVGGKMGHFLKETYSEKYLVFGFTYGQGTYAAYGPEKHYEVHPPFAGTYEYLFSKSKFENYLLDIRNINEIDFINQSAGFRSIGSRPQETTQFTDIVLKDHFDVILYLSNCVHTTRVD